MPLLDHFHPPLYPRHRWHGFHNAWATYLAAALNETLPPAYFAEPNVQFGIEIDTAILREARVVYSTNPVAASGNGLNGDTFTTNWQPPAPSQTIPFELSEDVVEVLVYAEDDGPTLVGAIELVSPANKDRPAQRNAFTAKCETYLHAGVGLIIVDIVTNRNATLNSALLERLETDARTDTRTEGRSDQITGEAILFAAAYHPLAGDGQPRLDLWYNPLTSGQELPTMPLWLRDGPCLPVLLEAAYMRTCHEQRIPTDLEVLE